MNILYRAFKYLKDYRLLSGAAIFSILALSLFESASFGMLIPLMQGMTNAKSNVLAQVPFMSGLAAYVSSLDQAKLLMAVFALMALMVIFKNVFLYFSNILNARIMLTVTRDYSVKMMNRVIEYDLQFFDRVKSGYIISNITTETARMGVFILSVLGFIALAARVSAYIALLFIISWKVSFIVFALMALVLLPLEVVMKKIKVWGNRLSLALADANFKLTEILGGIKVVKAHSAEDIEKKGFGSIAGRLFEIYYRINKYTALLAPVSETVMFILLVACFFVMTRYAKMDMANAFPFIATYLLTLVRALTMLNLLNTTRSNAVKDIGAFDSYEALYDRRGKKSIESGAKPIGRFSDSVELKDVSFSYTSDKPVLQDVTVKIPKGKITAIVGASGSGKTTLVNLIMRFYDTSKGYVLVDGVNIKDLDLKEWRNKIGFVSQDIFIFNASVKDNISYGHENITSDKVIEAARAANAHDFIMELPDAYDTVLGERGVSLSGGQKQRISIARAVLHNPEILVLDEATSSLDTKTERLIRDAVERLARNRTVIAIAHRLSTVVHADNIIVLDAGKVVECGAHTELMKNEGVYKKLHESQFDMPTAK